MSKKNQYTPVTIHDAKNIMLDFFQDEDFYRKNNSLLIISKQQHKALITFNAAVRKKRKELEKKILSGKEVQKSADLLQLKEKTELKLPLWIKDTLVDEYVRFRYSEFKLEEIPYFRITNRIHFLTGKDFKFVIDCKFKRYVISRTKVLKMTKLSEDNFTLYLIDLFKKGFEEQKKIDLKTLKKDELESRKKVYAKIEMVIAHNISIATDDNYQEELYKIDDKGNLLKKQGKYPMMFELKEEIMDVFIP